ncbi:MAG: 4-hydroxy-3-methylbut-2-enyl diphosphate reductase [Bacteroidia bacterium]|nr:4-hydroxy-3-methylbut-2-enyl diphosphate reductase [Bacteroidia bacterium]
MLKVEVDQQSGFCFGVVYAIEMAEDFLHENDHLYCLGDIVHNNKEVERLQAMGLRIISHEDLPNLMGETVLIRAHGEPPSTYKTALENDITLIDASCPVVLKLQNRVRKAYDEEQQIVVYGKPGHAEVNGILGQTLGNATVITSAADLENLDYSRPIQMFSQTTKSTKSYYNLKGIIESKTEEVKVNDTICRQVSNREPELQRFAAQYDVVVFVAGKKSSNGIVLHDVCKAVNPRTHFVSDMPEIDPVWFRDAETVGICGATSTPMWLMEEAATYIRNITPEAILA